MHLKRQEIPKEWPVPRKGTKYVVRSKSDFRAGIPILILLRDVLKVAGTRREVKRAVYLKSILLNGRNVHDEKTNVSLFDIITITPSKKNYRLTLSGRGKYELKEIKNEDADKKIMKIIDKKILRGKKIQLNLSDGWNLLSDIKCKTNDSVVINFKKKKIERCLPLKEKSRVIIFSGKYSGEKGVIEKLKTERKMAKIGIDGKEINVLIKQLMVIE